MKRIPEPKQQSEFEVHAFLWSSLRSLGINARGEVKVPYDGAGTQGRKATCRFDLAIFEDGFMVGIIEVKSAQRDHRREDGWLSTRQGSRYVQFGVPVLIVYGQKQAEELVAKSVNGKVDWRQNNKKGTE